MTWSLKTSVPYSSSTRLILRSLSQGSSIHSTQGKERMFRVYFDLAKCFETIDGNRGGALELRLLHRYLQKKSMNQCPSCCYQQAKIV